MRKIPATMVTQHPDHANAPYWHDKPFITTKHEPYELYSSFQDLGATEYKWDWEGKLVDEAVIDRIFSTYYEYFKNREIGLHHFLTFRLPNPKVETEFRLGRAFMSIIAASGLAKLLKFHTPPLFEVILPMTETSEEMIAIQDAFYELTSLRHPLLKQENGIRHIEVIPLFEDIHTIADSDKILKNYLALHKEHFNFLPGYMRPYVARSDPALNAGIVPTVLAIKIALSNYKKLEKQTGIKMYPIIGAAALPFRGGLRPDDVDRFIDEYQGIRTTTIQSAFRYDFDKKIVKKAIARLESRLPKSKAISVSKDDEKELRSIMKIFEKEYRLTIEKIADLVNTVANYVPKRRERVQHIGLFGYSRGVGTVKLPRAIGFTAALYSIGIPPEVIGTGRGLHKIMKQKKLRLLEKYYINIVHDLTEALKFANIPLIEKLAKTVPGVNYILKDIQYIEEYLRLKKIVIKAKHKEHIELSNKIFERIKKNKSPEGLIEKAGKLRRSMG